MEAVTFNYYFVNQKEFLCDDFIDLFVKVLILWNRTNNARSYEYIFCHYSSNNLDSPFCVWKRHQKVDEFILGEVIEIYEFEHEQFSE